MQFHRAVIGAGLLYSAIVFTLAPRFPPISSDETVRMVMARHWVQGEPVRYSLYDDVFVQSAYALREVIPDLSITGYRAWLGLWGRAGHYSYLAGRLSSWAAGLLALVVFYAVGCCLGGRRLGGVCAFLMSINPLVLTASCLTRPETLLLLTGTLTVWLILTIPDRLEWKPFLIGLLSALQICIHPNAVVMAMGSLVLMAYALRGRALWRTLGLFAAGALTGSLVVLLTWDIPRVRLSYTVHSALLRPPITVWPWTPLQWIGRNYAIWWSAISNYFASDRVASWTQSIRLGYLAMALGVILAARRAAPAQTLLFPARWLLASAAVLIGMICLVKARDCVYLINVLPFIIPLVASALVKQGDLWHRVGKTIAVACFGFSLVFFVRCYRTFSAHSKPYAEIVEEVKALVSDPVAKVAGPAVLWFAWDRDRFRDSGTVLVSRWYAGGSFDIQAWLAPWHPDILILDEPMQDLQQRLGPKGRFLQLIGVVDTGWSYGRWWVYRVRWTR